MRRTGDGKRGEVSELWTKHTTSIFMICTAHRKLLSW